MMENASAVLMDEVSEGNPRTISKRYKPLSLTPFMVCLFVTVLSLLTCGLLGFFQSTSTESEFNVQDSTSYQFLVGFKMYLGQYDKVDPLTGTLEYTVSGEICYHGKTDDGPTKQYAKIRCGENGDTIIDWHSSNDCSSASFLNNEFSGDLTTELAGGSEHLSEIGLDLKLLIDELQYETLDGEVEIIDFKCYTGADQKPLENSLAEVDLSVFKTNDCSGNEQAGVARLYFPMNTNCVPYLKHPHCELRCLEPWTLDYTGCTTFCAECEEYWTPDATGKMIYNEGNCDGKDWYRRYHDYKYEDYPLDGTSTGNYEIGCNGEDSLRIKYWKSDASCNGNADAIFDLNLGDLVFPDIISDLIDGEVSRPIKHDTCIDSHWIGVDDEFTNSVKINTMTCKGSDASHTYGPVKATSSLTFPNEISSSLTDLTGIFVSTSMFSSTRCSSSTVGSEISAQIWIDEPMCVRHEDDYYKIFVRSNHIGEIQKFTDAQCSGTNHVDTAGDWMYEIENFMDFTVGHGECVELSDKGPQMRVDAIGTNADDMTDKNPKGTAEDVLIDAELKVYKSHDCSGTAVQGHMKVFAAHEVNCHEWLGAGYGHLQIGCSGQNDLKISYYGDDSTCSGMPLLNTNWNLEGMEMPEGVLRYLTDDLGLFDTLPIPTIVGSASGTCMPMKDTSISIKIDELYCIGRDDPNAAANKESDSSSGLSTGVLIAIVVVALVVGGCVAYLVLTKMAMAKQVDEQEGMRTVE